MRVLVKTITHSTHKTASSTQHRLMKRWHAAQTVACGLKNTGHNLYQRSIPMTCRVLLSSNKNIQSKNKKLTLAKDDKYTIP
ncbi:hypothetical protein E2C01_005403 [Portunus trituberculatus]|uniref:Uncharacterized protein n=1 Tax=Portunus trituberculatus TaxID=210409 RepID=A0A5B7CUB5_PORTR|nr:hypothetical protein [Portunus trituberculatus]